MTVKKTQLIETTIKRHYMIPVNKNGYTLDGRTVDELIQEWFYDFDINRHHASRSAHQLGNGDVLQSVQLVEKHPREK